MRARFSFDEGKMLGGVLQAAVKSRVMARSLFLMSEKALLSNLLSQSTMLNLPNCHRMPMLYSRTHFEFDVKAEEAGVCQE